MSMGFRIVGCRRTSASRASTGSRNCAHGVDQTPTQLSNALSNDAKETDVLSHPNMTGAGPAPHKNKAPSHAAAPHLVTNKREQLDDLLQGRLDVLVA